MVHQFLLLSCFIHSKEGRLFRQTDLHLGNECWVYGAESRSVQAGVEAWFVGVRAKREKSK